MLALGRKRLTSTSMAEGSTLRSMSGSACSTDTSGICSDRQAAAPGCAATASLGAAECAAGPPELLRCTISALSPIFIPCSAATAWSVTAWSAYSKKAYEP